MITENNPWFITSHRRPEARLRLFCFPFAGGAASVFHNWHKRLSPYVEVVAVQYPGRETRWGEAALDDAERMAHDIFEAIGPLIEGQPFLFFGHSLGAMMSFEVSRLLNKSGMPEPSHLFFSGRRAPPFDPNPPILNGLEDEEFVQVMGTLEGTPGEVLNNPDLMALLLPMLRADFTLDEKYVYKPGGLLWQDITIYGGLADVKVPEDELRAWAQFTKGNAAVRMFPGGHFYLKDESSPFFQAFSDALNTLVFDLT